MSVVHRIAPKNADIIGEGIDRPVASTHRNMERLNARFSKPILGEGGHGPLATARQADRSLTSKQDIRGAVQRCQRPRP
jgi:hypothetical protein